MFAWKSEEDRKDFIDGCLAWNSYWLQHYKESYKEQKESIKEYKELLKRERDKAQPDQWMIKWYKNDIIHHKKMTEAISTHLKWRMEEQEKYERLSGKTWAKLSFDERERLQILHGIKAKPDVAPKKIASLEKQKKPVVIKGGLYKPTAKTFDKHLSGAFNAFLEKERQGAEQPSS